MASALAYGSGNSDVGGKYEELWHESKKLAEAHWDIETSGTFLYKADQRAEFAREVLRDLQAEKFSSRGAALKKINEVVGEKYGQGYYADNMVKHLAKRVTASGSVSAWDLRGLDWEMLSEKLKGRMKDIGVTPATLPALPTDGNFFKEGIKHKYREVRNELQSLAAGYPGLKVPPVNPFMFFSVFPGGKIPEIRRTGDFSVPAADIEPLSEDSDYSPAAPVQGPGYMAPVIDIRSRQPSEGPGPSAPSAPSAPGSKKAEPEKGQGKKKKRKLAGQAPADQAGAPEEKEEVQPVPEPAGARTVPGAPSQINVPKVVVKPGAKAPSKTPSIPSPKVVPGAGAPPIPAGLPGQPGLPVKGPVSGPEAVKIRPDEIVRDLEKERDKAIKEGQRTADQAVGQTAPRKAARVVSPAPESEEGGEGQEAPPASPAAAPADVSVSQPADGAGASDQPADVLEQPAASPLPDSQVIPIQTKMRAPQDSQADLSKSYNELHKDSEDTALAFQDLSNPNTDLGQANERAKGARGILGDIKSLQDIDPAVQEVVEEKIKQIVNDRYGDSPESRQMAQSLVDRVGSDGSVDDDNLEELDWQMVPSGAKAKLAGLGVSPAVISVPASQGTFLEKGLENKYQNNRQTMKAMSRRAPGLSLPPVNPADLKSTSGPAAKKAVQTGALVAGTAAGAGAAQFYLRHPIDAGGLRTARRGAAGKLAGKPQRMGSGHWQPQLAHGPTPGAPMGEEGMEPPKAEGEAEEGPPTGAGLEGGRPGPLPAGQEQPTPPPGSPPPGPGGVPGQEQGAPFDAPPGEDIPDEDLPENLRKERQEYRDKQAASTLAMLPMMIGSGGLDDAGQLEGIKDPETGGNLDLSKSLEDVTGQRDSNAAFNASDKEITDLENEEARSLSQKKKKGEPEEDEQGAANKRNARKAKLAAGLRKHIKNHKNTKWGILFGIAAFEDLMAVVDVFVVGILYLIVAPIIFCCWIYKSLAFAGKEGDAEKAWKYGAWITEQIPYINWLPAALGYMFKMYVGSLSRMKQAQKQLKRLEKKMSKRQAKRRVKKLQQKSKAA